MKYNNNKSKKKIKKVNIILILIIIGIVLRLILPFMSTDTVLKWNSDDMYYYLDLAKELAETGVPSADGGVSTANGFHPIYLLLLVWMFKIIKGDIYLAIPISLIILSVFNLLTTLFIYKICKSLFSKKTGIIASLLWLFNPFVFFIAYSGVEAPIAGFFIAGTVYYYLINKKEGGKSSFVLLCLFSGLAFLSRTDSVFLLAVLFFDMLVGKYKQYKMNINTLIRPFLYTLFTFIIATPWFIWNLINFGTIMQSSATTIAFRSHSLFLSKYGSYMGYGIIIEAGKWLFIWMYKFLNMFGNMEFMGLALGLLAGVLANSNRKNLENIRIKGSLIIISLATIFLTSLLNLNSSYLTLSMPQLMLDMVLSIVLFSIGWRLSLFNGWKKCPMEVSFLKKNYLFIIWMTIIVLFYSTYLWHFQIWYIYSPYIFMTIFVSALYYYYEKLFNKRTWAIITFLILFIFFYKGAYLYHNAYPQVNPQFYSQERIDCFREFIEDNPNVKLGSFDSGMAGYFLIPNLVNLDGVVNNQINMAIKQGDLFGYLNEKNIKYVSISDERIEEYSATEGFDISKSLMKKEICGAEFREVVK